MAETPKLRISDGHKYLLTALALFFDVLPVLVLIVAAALAFAGINDFTSCFGAATSGWFSWAGASCAVAVAKGAVTGGLTIAALFFAGPILYAVVSMMVSLIAGLFFTLVFFFGYHVNIWEMRSNRLMVNLFTGLIEVIPVLNLLPGVTVMVWSHATISQKTDRAAIKLAQQQGAAGQLGRRAVQLATRGRTSGAAIAPVVRPKRTVYPQQGAQQNGQARYTRVNPEQRSFERRTAEHSPRTNARGPGPQRPIESRRMFAYTDPGNTPTRTERPVGTEPAAQRLGNAS